MEDLIRQMLEQLGEDPSREGLKNTPERTKQSLEFLTSGYQEDPETIVNDAVFNEDCNHMIIARDIEVYSLCEHHMLPFFGVCHIGYIPQGKVFGVSKLARLVDCYARRLQLQERLTQQIAHTVQRGANAHGVGVIVKAQHLCMMMRGVEKQGSEMVTSAMLGSFRESVATRSEFLTLTDQRNS